MRPAPLLLVLLLGGCSTWYGQRPACPLPEMTDVAVLPVLGAPDGLQDRFGEVLSAELVQFPGIERVVRPGEAQLVLTTHGLNRSSLKDLRELAKELGVDAIMAAELKEFSMYDPPRAVVWCGLVVASRRARDPSFALRMVRGGSLPQERGDATDGAYRLERVYDTETHDTSGKLSSYLRRNNSEMGGLPRDKRVLRVGTNFFRFVSEQTVRDLFSLLKEKAADDRSKESDRKLVYREG